MLPLLGMALGGLSSLSQIYNAERQRRAADKLNPIRPVYSLPSALNESVAMARQSAGGLMPGMGNALNAIQGSTANASRAAQVSGSGNATLATIAAAQGNEAIGLNQLAAQQAQYNTGQRMNLQNNLSALAQEQRNAFQYNKADKFREESAAKASLQGSAIQNRHAGISGLANIGMQGIMGLQNQRQEQQQATDQAHINNFSGYHQGQLNQMRNTPLFGGTLSQWPY